MCKTEQKQSKTKEKLRKAEENFESLSITLLLLLCEGGGVDNNRGLSYTSGLRPNGWQVMTMVGFGSLQSSWHG